MATDEAEPGTGHNSQSRLLSYVERLERLAEERAGLGEDMKEVFGEAKSDGFDVAVLRKVLAIRAKGIGEWREAVALVETYLNATGDV